MFGPKKFRDLVSGQSHGVGPATLRGGLRAAEVLYTAAVRWRNRRYDRGASAIHRVSVPVVSVGNLTLGGTGKSPMVEWLVRWMRDQHIRAAVISRGYGAGDDAWNDEAKELSQKLPDVPHLQNPDRVAAARQAIAQFGCEAIVLDDGFQHRRIARDVDIVLLDALEPFGFGHIFPRGTLREPVEGLRRTSAVVLSRADLIQPTARQEIWRTVQRHAPQAVEAEAIHAPSGLVAHSGRQSPIEDLRGQSVAAFCGIGNPAGFRHTLESCGCHVAAFWAFGDHHRFSQKDIDALVAWIARFDVSAVLCTRKDLVKLSTDLIGGKPLWALDIALDFLSGCDALKTVLTRAFGR